MSPLSRLWRLWSDIDAQTRDFQPALPGDARPRLDYRPLVVLVVVAVSLTMQEYFGDRGFFMRAKWVPDFMHSGDDAELWTFVWWTSWRVVGFLLIPLATVLLMPGERLRDYHWSLSGFTRHWKLYLLLFSLVLPLVYFMAQTKGFQRIYPFYRQANRSAFDFWAWEALYAAQFLSLEFFFRGFMLRALAPSMGVHSIWVMCVPYCMIHYGKTFSECIAAIFAGVILGTIALRTRSIWGGVLIHIAVAVTMDALTVGQLR